MGGIRHGAPRLTPLVEFAAKAAGGLHFIERCSEEQLGWCRKTFMAAYTNVQETRQVHHLLGDCEEKRILAELRTPPAVMERKQVKAPEPESKLPARSEVKAVLERVAEIPSEEEWEGRKREHKRRAEEWAIAHRARSSKEANTGGFEQ